MVLKMFAVIFALALTTAYAAELPSYINVCGRKNPNLSQCVADNIHNLRHKICEGLTELNLPAPEPLNISKLILSETANNKVYLKDIKITGLCNYHINSVFVDIDKLILIIDVSFDQLYLNGTYDIDIHILVPIAHKAPLYITSDNVNFKGTLQADTTNKNGKKHIYVSKAKAIIDITEYDIKYGFNKNEIDQLNQIVSGFISSNQEEFIERLKPLLEEAIVKWLVSISNNLFKMFSYDELFPDRE